MFRPLTIALLLVSWLPINAVEWREDPAQDAREARALHSAAQAARDIWTCLMIEGWFAEHPGLRPIQPLLGRGAVLGNPWLAFPESLHNHWIHQAGVGAIAGRLYFSLDHEGRPLRMPLRLPFSPQRSGLSHNGNHLGIARLITTGNVPQVHISIHHEPGPGTQSHHSSQPSMSATVSLHPLLMNQRAWLDSPLRVSADGSGAAVATNYNINSRHEVHLFANDRRIHSLANARNPRIVGNGALWVIYEDMEAAHTNFFQIGSLERRQVETYAYGPGIAVIRHDGSLHMIATDGRMSAWQPSQLTTGRNPEVWSHGSWLVVGSGHGAVRESIHDMFGNPVSSGGPAPYRLGFYRWQELLTNPAAAPVLTVDSSYHSADNHRFALLRMVSNSVQRIDLSGEERPVFRPLIRFDTNVTAIQADHHHYVATLDDGNMVAFNPDGTILWRGPAVRAWVQARRYLLIERSDGSMHAVTLHADPEARRTITLAPTPSQPIHIDGRGRFVSSGHQHDENRRLYDPDSGTLIRDERRHRRLASLGRAWQENDSRGPFYRQNGRLIPKSRGTDNRPATDHWCPQDAWLLNTPLGNRLIALDHDGWLYFGDPSDASLHTEAIMGGDEFRSLGDRRLWVAHNRWIQRPPDGGTRRWEIRTAIDERGNISHEWMNIYQDTQNAEYNQVSAMPDFNWRQTRDQFIIPPRSEQRRWDGDGLGWTPSRFRGQANTMLLITPSVILAPSRSHLQALTVRHQ